MKCVLCRCGETRPGHTTVTLERDGSVVVLRNVPAQVCCNCGEAYVDRAVSAELLRTADAELRSGVQMTVRDFVTPATA